MKRFWISWWQPTDDHRPLTYPPNAAILGWWCSGETDTAWSLCALVVAKTEAAARKAVRKDWPEATDWRFCDERTKDWLPNDRFPLNDWMKSRLGTDAKSKTKAKR